MPDILYEWNLWWLNFWYEHPWLWLGWGGIMVTVYILLRRVEAKRKGGK